MESWVRLRRDVAAQLSAEAELYDELDSLSPPSPGEEVEQVCRPLWVQQLESRTAGLVQHKPDTPLRLVSSCTGCFAEAAVLKETGDYVEVEFCLPGGRINSVAERTCLPPVSL